MKRDLYPGRIYLLTAFTTLVALGLTVMPLPSWSLWLRPAWVALVIIFWVMSYPHIVGMASAWMIGLFLDDITGSVLGEHALAMALVAFLSLQLHRQLQNVGMLQQTLTIMLLLFIYQITIMLLQGMIGQFNSVTYFWLPALTSSLLWPSVSSILSELKLRYVES